MHQFNRKQQKINDQECSLFQGYVVRPSILLVIRLLFGIFTKMNKTLSETE